VKKCVRATKLTDRSSRVPKETPDVNSLLDLFYDYCIATRQSSAAKLTNGIM
jgi:hypothetical protein